MFDSGELSGVTKTGLDARKLTVTNPVLVEQAGFAGAPPFSSSVRHHLSFSSSSTTQQGVHQDLQADGDFSLPQLVRQQIRVLTPG